MTCKLFGSDITKTIKTNPDFADKLAAELRSVQLRQRQEQERRREEYMQRHAERTAMDDIYDSGREGGSANTSFDTLPEYEQVEGMDQGEI